MIENRCFVFFVAFRRVLSLNISSKKHFLKMTSLKYNICLIFFLETTRGVEDPETSDRKRVYTKKTYQRKNQYIPRFTQNLTKKLKWPFCLLFF